VSGELIIDHPAVDALTGVTILFFVSGRCLAEARVTSLLVRADVAAKLAIVRKSALPNKVTARHARSWGKPDRPARFVLILAASKSFITRNPLYGKKKIASHWGRLQPQILLVWEES
jgi:hypothetical protein